MLAHKTQQTHHRAGGKIRLSSALLLLVAALPLHAYARDKSTPAKMGHDTDAARRDVQAVYDRQCAALMRRDVNAFLALCTPDYKDVKRGTGGRGQVHPVGLIRQTLPRQLARYSDFTMTATISTFALHGNRATATATRHVSLTFPDPRTHRKRAYKSDTRTQDAWIKTPQGWRTQSSRETEYKKR